MGLFNLFKKKSGNEPENKDENPAADTGIFDLAHAVIVYDDSKGNYPL